MRAAPSPRPPEARPSVPLTSCPWRRSGGSGRPAQGSISWCPSSVGAHGPATDAKQDPEAATAAAGRLAGKAGAIAAGRGGGEGGRSGRVLPRSGEGDVGGRRCSVLGTRWHLNAPLEPGCRAHAGDSGRHPPPPPQGRAEPRGGSAGRIAPPSCAGRACRSHMLAEPAVRRSLALWGLLGALAGRRLLVGRGGRPRDPIPRW